MSGRFSAGFVKIVYMSTKEQIRTYIISTRFYNFLQKLSKKTLWGEKFWGEKLSVALLKFYSACKRTFWEKMNKITIFKLFFEIWAKKLLHFVQKFFSWFVKTACCVSGKYFERILSSFPIFFRRKNVQQDWLFIEVYLVTICQKKKWFFFEKKVEQKFQQISEALPKTKLF